MHATTAARAETELTPKKILMGTTEARFLTSISEQIEWAVSGELARSIVLGEAGEDNAGLTYAKERLLVVNDSVPDNPRHVFCRWRFIDLLSRRAERPFVGLALLAIEDFSVARRSDGVFSLTRCVTDADVIRDGKLYGGLDEHVRSVYQKYVTAEKVGHELSFRDLLMKGHARQVDEKIAEYHAAHGQ